MIPGTIFRLIIEQATEYGPYVGDILRGSPVSQSPPSLLAISPAPAFNPYSCSPPGSCPDHLHAPLHACTQAQRLFSGAPAHVYE